MRIIDSVAAVFCHNDSVFAVRRQSYLSAFPGYDSFPGGKIDREDLSAQHPSRLLSDLDGRSMHALVREIGEELNYDLPAGIASGQVTAVKYLAMALAPAITSIRFRLLFYRIDVATRPQFEVDSGEIAGSYWKSPQQLLESFVTGDALMVPPLRWMLERLHQNPQGDDFGDLSPVFDEDNYVPSIELLSGLRMLSVPSNTFPPIKRTNAFLIGDDHSSQILIDPSPESLCVLDKLIRTLANDNLTAIFLTHHHYDHHEHAPELARHLDIPIWMSNDTYTRIIQKYGSDYFSDIKIEFKQDGDHITNWKGEPVQVYSIPGHDAGQLALAPKSLRWFLVGDLIQSTGTVVISAPEGDMATYFKTLENLIALDPEVIIPSHGMPMRSVYRLQTTLRHRHEREKTIKKLYLGGKSKAEILTVIYSDIDPQLHSIAIQSIESHLTKLCQENQIIITE